MGRFIWQFLSKKGRSSVPNCVIIVVALSRWHIFISLSGRLHGVPLGKLRRKHCFVALGHVETLILGSLLQVWFVLIKQDKMVQHLMICFLLPILSFDYTDVHVPSFVCISSENYKSQFKLSMLAKKYCIV